MLIFLAIFTIIYAQQCPQFCERCSSLGNCSQCQANQFMVIASPSSIGCLPCAVNCQRCTNTSSFGCTTCAQQYYLSINSSLCIACQAYMCITCSQYNPLRCQQCKKQFYLIESTAKCSPCTDYINAKICRQNIIMECIDEFYSQNGQICQKCQKNCIKCRNQQSCTECKHGYFINRNNSCQPCHSTCQNCSSSDYCISCPQRTFLNQSQICQHCSQQNCFKCNQNNKCIECQEGFTVTNQNQCNLLEKPIASCLRHASNTSGQYCIKCKQNFYLSKFDLSCQPCSILCAQCTGNYRISKCTKCAEGSHHSDRTQTICTPQKTLINGRKQLYITINNNFEAYHFGEEVVFLKALEQRCMVGTFSNHLIIDLGLIKGYQFQIMLKVGLTPQIAHEYEVKINSQSIGSKNMSFYSLCANKILIGKNNILFNNSNGIVNENNTLLKFQTNSNQVFITVLQLSIIYSSCHQSCLQCLSHNQCNTCRNSSQYREENKCVQSCSNEFYLYPSQKICLKVCPFGTYSDPYQEYWTCEKCLQECQSCISSSICLSCKPTYYFYSKNQSCLLNCPAKFTPNHINTRCQTCSFPCMQCNQNGSCLSCSQNLLYNGTCVSECFQGFYQNLGTRSCLPCQEPCKRCSSRQKCTMCIPSLSLLMQKCVQRCPSFYTNVDGRCQSCQFPCSKCINTVSSCTSCYSGFLMNSSCIKTCPNQYYAMIETMSCQLCKPPCKFCDGAQNRCTSCIKQLLLQSDTYSCDRQCPQGYYEDQKQCKKCRSQCSICLNFDNCTACQTKYFLEDHQCVQRCSVKLYANIKTNQCQKCDKNCLSCEYQSKHCLSCGDGLTLSLNYSCDQICQPGQLSPGCSPCLYPCRQCSITTSTCTRCVLQHFLHHNQCMKQCKDGYYATYILGLSYCKPCTSQCVRCQNEENCQQCGNNQKGEQFYLQSSKCVSKCAQRYYPQINICMRCLQPCEQCRSILNCTTCATGSLNDGRCIECPLGKYSSSGMCKVCVEQCLSCSSFQECNSCQKGYYLNLKTKKCINQCQVGFAAIKTTRTCELCQYPCSQCIQSSRNCTKCSQVLLNETKCASSKIFGNECILYFLHNNNCLFQCHSTFYAQGLVCKPCTLPCLTCINSLSCTSCSSNFNLLNNQCDRDCPNGYYASLSNCISCPYPCSKCSTPNFCQDCLDGVFSEGHCLLQEQCPLSQFTFYYQNGSKSCQPCSGNCLYCSRSAQQCLQCKNGLKILQGICYHQCKLGYYTKNISSSFVQESLYMACQKCPQQCFSCENLLICTSCSQTYSLLNYSCVQGCPYNYLLAINKQHHRQCLKCEYPCLKCVKQPKYCRICEQGFYLYLSNCVKKCPSDTYLELTSKMCKQCTFPCKQCLSKLQCTVCLKGYYLQVEGYCVQKCLLGQVINIDRKKCQSNCQPGQLVLKNTEEQISYCTLKCRFPYLQLSHQCVLSCPNSSYYIYRNLTCSIQPLDNSLHASLKIFTDTFSNLFIALYFTEQVHYFFTQQINSLFSITLQSKNNQSRILQRQKLTQIPFKVKITQPSYVIFQLTPYSNIPQDTSVSITFRKNNNLKVSSKVSGELLQNSYYKISSQYYQYYSKSSRNNRFAIIGQVFIDFVWIISLLLLLLNRFAKVYPLLQMTQILFLLGTLEISYPPNLGRFLIGFKWSHLFQFPNILLNTTLDYPMEQVPARLQALFIDINFTTIAGHTILLYFIFLLTYMFLVLLKFFLLYKYESTHKIIVYLEKTISNFKWSYTNDVMFVLGPITFVSFWWQTYDYSMSSSFKIFGVILCYFLFASHCGYLIIAVCRARKVVLMSQLNSTAFQSHKYFFRENMLYITEGITDPSSIYKYYMQVGKIVAYGTIFGLLSTSPMLCLALTSTLSGIYFCIYALFKPYSSEKQNYFQAVSQILLGIGMVLLAILNYLTQPDLSEAIQITSKKWILGWIIIIIFLACIFSLIVAFILSLIMGSLNIPHLEAEETDSISKIHTPKYLLMEPKMQFQAWSCNDFGYKSQQDAIKETN